MKEKLLMFVGFNKILTKEQTEELIKAFRRKYPRFRTVEEVESIDYTTQYVKIILIECNSNVYKHESGYTVYFRNTKGLSYMSFLHTTAKSSL